MLIVISPAKNLDYDSPIPTRKHSKAAFLDDAAALVADLQQLSPQDLSKLMGISDKLSVLNYDRYQQWQLPFKASTARQAILAFKGDVYQGLEAYQFSDADFAFAQQHLRILSGLYGVLRPLDWMQAYRLEMGTAFANPRGKNLYEFWGEKVTQALNKQLQKLRSKTLINLASNEYFKSVTKPLLQADIITPSFKDWKNGQYKMISFFAKKARGRMSAYIIKNGLTDPEGLKHFDWDGYHYNEAMSNGREWVFIRKQ